MKEVIVHNISLNKNINLLNVVIFGVVQPVFNYLQIYQTNIVLNFIDDNKKFMEEK